MTTSDSMADGALRHPTGGEDAATRLSVQRTRLSNERTLMAWIRTSTSLISFGFTMYKALQYLPADPAAPRRAFGPREFALVMISTGVAALVLAAIEHTRNVRHLRAEFGALVPRSLTLPIAAVVVLLGLISLLAVLFRQ